MQLNTDLHYQYALDRPQRLRAEAAAERLVDATPARTRVARFLCRAANRLDTAIACGRGRDPLAERN